MITATEIEKMKKGFEKDFNNYANRQFVKMHKYLVKEMTKGLQEIINGKKQEISKTGR